MNVSLEHQSATTVAGWTAMQNIAKRYQQFFPTLLPSEYDPNWYLFRSTSLRQAQASIRGFADGLFGDGGWASVEFENVPVTDWLLRPINFCPAFQAETASMPERDAFVEGPEVEQMLVEVNRRLGFHGANQLSFETIFTMWEWCRFELSSVFEISTSPIGYDSAWCAPFTIVHNEILEYYMDLFYYHFTGYGVRNQRLIENLNCGLFQDLLLHIQGNPNEAPVAKIYVTHQHSIQSFLVTLGAMRDETRLHQYNFAQQSFRHWKTSFLTSNAGNIAVVSYT